jgi:hypothetical protein
MSWIAIVAGVVVSILVFTWLIKVVQATLKTAFLIAVILFGLNFFGIGPGNLVNGLIDGVAAIFAPK